MIKIDLEKTPFQNIIDLINGSSTHTFSESDLLISDPTLITPQGRNNTRITISPSSTGSIRGEPIIRRYRRLDLSSDLPNKQSTYIVQQGTDRETIEELIKTGLGLHSQSTFMFNWTNPLRPTISSHQNDYLYTGQKEITIVYQWHK